jgi:hypothetical protein
MEKMYAWILFPKPLIEPMIAKMLPQVMQVQLDNYAKDNKNKYVFAC